MHYHLSSLSEICSLSLNILFSPMNNDQTVCSLYFLSEQNIILPPAELLVSLCLKASVANLHCTDWPHVYMLCVRGRGVGWGGQVSLLRSQRIGPDGP